MFPPLLVAKAFFSKNLFLLIVIPLLLVAIYMAGFSNGKEEGQIEVQAQWDADTVIRLEAEQLATITRRRDNENLKTQYEILLDQTKESYEALLRNRPPITLTGLRLPKGVCPDNGSGMPKGITNPGLPSSTSEEGRLPKKVEQDLRELADDATACTDTLVTLQDLLITYKKLNKARKEPT